jgi:hypothetical protein
MEKGDWRFFLLPALKIRVHNVESERDVRESKAKIIWDAFL